MIYIYSADFTYETRDGQPATETREFTYPNHVTDPTDLADIAEHLIGIAVSSRRLHILAVRPVRARLKTDFV
ncbi:hypothetical protein [Couchioplanes caeruleus]|uniref:Uncharacterized protein n=2 Tax=Couchioplanes caeruleus TaxID=56438 RepID=A0A1K0GHJ9_9ACTN|nr:hypothetical protein [Couchioplanes caeruleus]OJF10396.1 hypothetical protein BG844_32185 [Couchioplanes caeruleus subsp. caeruleus]ROP29782.1 hypothetical protein EDD30_2597 [Couchioplanes caeruleus]